MPEKPFNPNDWEKVTPPQSVQPEPGGTSLRKIEHIIHQIEIRKLDLVPEYGDWRNVGFAFADELGERGRTFYHRISRFHPNYSMHETDQQFDRCLKAKGHGITMGTFYYWARQAGILPQQPQSKSMTSEPKPLPNFPDALYKNLPDFLQKVTSVCKTGDERDMMLLGSLVTLSACLPTVYGIYDGRKVHANLFIFVNARASAGKGKLIYCKHLVHNVHMALREESNALKLQYKEELSRFQKQKSKGQTSPLKPSEKLLFIPANTSTTGVFQLLADNNGRGLIFETEGDTLSNTFKSDYGNYSDGFRKAFHHESISYYRRMDREYVDIDNPQLSTVLSGTPQQIKTLIPNVENGLFSRFLFYSLPMRPEWKDVFSHSANEGLGDHFKLLGHEFHRFYKVLIQQPKIHFQFTTQQRKHFNQFFTDIQQEYLQLQGIDYMATIRRLGLNAFRISMILSILSGMNKKSIPSSPICSNQDFQTALEIIRVLVKHAAHVFTEIQSGNVRQRAKNKKARFYDHLPETFNRQSYLSIAEELNIASKTAERYVYEFVKGGSLHHDAKDQYQKSL